MHRTVVLEAQAIAHWLLVILWALRGRLDEIPENLLRRIIASPTSGGDGPPFDPMYAQRKGDPHFVNRLLFLAVSHYAM